MKKLETISQELLSLWNNGKTAPVLEALEDMSPLETAIVVYYISKNEQVKVGELSFVESISAVVTARNLFTTKPSPASLPTNDSRKHIIENMGFTKPAQEVTYITRSYPDNCRDCAFHAVVPDPDLEDSFNRDDCAVVCKKTPNSQRDRSSTWVAQRQEFQVISGSNRPYEIDSVTPPDWCPLKAR